MALDWLVSGGISLLGGLFSSMGQKSRDKKNAEAARKANEANEARVTKMNADVRRRAERAASVPIVTNQQTAGSVDVKGMMAGAEAAGFNPITWLRNGGMQAYARTTSSSQVYNSQLMDAALAGSTIFQESAPPLSTAQTTGEVIGNALNTGASAWVNEASQERQNQFQMGLLQMQLDGQNKPGAYSGRRSGYVPTAFLGGSHTTANNSAVLAGGTGDAFKWVSGPNGTYMVPNQEVLPSPELYLSAALMPWIDPSKAGQMGGAFQRMGDDFLNDIGNPFGEAISRGNPWMTPPAPLRKSTGETPSDYNAWFWQ